MTKKVFKSTINCYQSIDSCCSRSLSLYDENNYRDSVSSALYTIEKDVKSWISPDDVPHHYDVIVVCDGVTMSVISVPSIAFI